MISFMFIENLLFKKICGFYESETSFLWKSRFFFIKKWAVFLKNVFFENSDSYYEKLGSLWKFRFFPEEKFKFLFQNLISMLCFTMFQIILNHLTQNLEKMYLGESNLELFRLHQFQKFEISSLKLDQDFHWLVLRDDRPSRFLESAEKFKIFCWKKSPTDSES